MKDKWNPQDATMATECDECGTRQVLTTIDGDGVLIGDECTCGHYTTRYMPGQEPKMTEGYARSQGFTSQAEMRGEDWS